jgi:crossover junction endodeoxyribonuclease RuvC
VIALGIDPGNEGALVALRVEEGLASPHAVLRMPATPKVGPDLHAVMDWLLTINPDRAVIERAQSMPGQGVASTFRYGVGYGGLIGLLVALEIPYETVPPATWHRDLCGARRSEGRTAAKGRALRVVRERLPGLEVVPPRCRVPDEGIVDAACVALWLVERRLRP